MSGVQLSQQARKQKGRPDGGQFDYGTVGDTGRLDRSGFDNPYAASEDVGSAAVSRKDRFAERMLRLTASESAVRHVAGMSDMDDIDRQVRGLAQDGHLTHPLAVGVVRAVAGNPNTSRYTLQQLSSHPDSGVQQALAGNPGQPAMTSQLRHDLLEGKPMPEGVQFPEGSLAEAVRSGAVKVTPTSEESIGVGDGIHVGYVLVHEMGSDSVTDLSTASAERLTVVKRDFELDSWDHDLQNSGHAAGTVVLTVANESGARSEIRLRRGSGMSDTLLLKAK